MGNRLLIPVLAAFCLVLAFLPESTSAQAGEPTLVVCLPSPVTSLDPTDYRDRETQIVLKQMFDSLTSRDDTLAVAPHLAETFRLVSDTEWEFTLKKGILFHNGNALTARDVFYTFDRVIRDGAINGHTSARQSLFGPLAEVVVVNDYILRFKTRSPWPVLPLMMTLQEIVPQGSLDRTGDQKDDPAPVGTGPFRFVEKRADGALVLRRFHGDAIDRGTGIPSNGTPVEWLVITSEPDVGKRMAMVKRGAADLVTRMPPEFLDMISLNPDLRILSQPATRSYFVEMNCRKKPFDDQRVRVAMNYAMDKAMIVRTVLKGKGQVLPTVLLPKAFAYDPSLFPYAYSPEKAKALIREAGFSMEDTLTICCEPDYQAFAQAVSLYLSRIGIRSRVVTEGKQASITAMKTLSADMMVSSWGNSTLDPVGIMVPKFQSQGQGNYSGYLNLRVDDLLGQAERTLDPARRKSCYQAAQKMIYKDAPMIFGYAADEFLVLRRGITGVEPRITGMLDLNHAAIDKEKIP